MSDGWCSYCAELDEQLAALQTQLAAAEKERDRLAQRERDMQTAINALCEDATETEGQLAAAHTLLREACNYVTATNLHSRSPFWFNWIRRMKKKVGMSEDCFNTDREQPKAQEKHGIVADLKRQLAQAEEERDEARKAAYYMLDCLRAANWKANIDECQQFWPWLRNKK